MLNAAQRHDYISSLDLADLPGHTAALISRTLTLVEDKAQGLVDAGSVVSFVAGISTQSRQDVLNSTLLAQLAANKAFDRESDTVGWYRKYREVLENIGWVVPEFSFTKYSGSGATFQVKDVVLKLLAAIMSENALTITKASVDAIEALGEGSDKVALFSSNASTSSMGNFQIGTVEEADGVPTMSLGTFYFRSSNIGVNFLWFHFANSNTEMYQGAQKVTLNQQIYAKVRQAVIDKLGNRAEEYVADLDI